VITHPPKTPKAQPVEFGNCASHKKFDDFQGVAARRAMVALTIVNTPPIMARAAAGV
jgi:hypothetical protein